MIWIRFAGMGLIVCGAAAAGFGAAANVRRTTFQLRELLRTLELMRCEMQYAKTPLPALCDTLARTARGAIGTLFSRLAEALRDGGTSSTQQAMQHAIAAVPRLHLPDSVLFSLLELGQTLGEYDLEGQTALLRLSQSRIESVLHSCEKEQKTRIRSYEALGLCSGAAAVILLL